MNSFFNVFNMHGYGVYVYSAYAIVISALSLHIFKTIKRAKYITKYIKKVISKC